MEKEGVVAQQGKSRTRVRKIAELESNQGFGIQDVAITVQGLGQDSKFIF